MNQLSSLRSNIFYEKTPDGEFIKIHEIILLLEKPEYAREKEGKLIIKTNSLEQVRFVVSDSNLVGLITVLQEIKDSDGVDKNLTVPDSNYVKSS